MNKKITGILICITLLMLTIPFTTLADVNKEKNTPLIPTEITIETPQQGNIYVMGAQFFNLPFGWTLIIGPITIRAGVTGVNGFSVDFYIDGVKVSHDDYPPFEYPWWDISFGKRTIQVDLIQESTVLDTASLDVFKII